MLPAIASSMACQVVRYAGANGRCFIEAAYIANVKVRDDVPEKQKCLDDLVRVTYILALL